MIEKTRIQAVPSDPKVGVGLGGRHSVFRGGIYLYNHVLKYQRCLSGELFFIWAQSRQGGELDPDLGGGNSSEDMSNIFDV